MSERAWQQQVVEFSQLCGWQHFHPLNMRGSDPGWPDLTLVRPPELRFVELKTERGSVSPAQQEWLAWLTRCGITAEVWRPRDWPHIERILRPDYQTWDRWHAQMRLGKLIEDLHTIGRRYVHDFGLHAMDDAVAVPPDPAEIPAPIVGWLRDLVLEEWRHRDQARQENP